MLSEVFHVDHIKPWSKSFDDSDKNLQVLCTVPYPENERRESELVTELFKVASNIVHMACVCGYNTTAALARHKRTCKVIAWYEKCTKLEGEVHRLTPENARLSAENARLLAENELLVKENSELHARLDESRNARPNVQNNNVTVNIVAYGQEPLPSMEEVLAILKPPESSVAKYIELKHFRRPETANLRIRNKRSRTMQVVEVDTNKMLRWTEKDRKRMIEQMVEANLDELTETHGAERVATWRSWYQRTGLDRDGFDKTDEFKRIQEDVENMLMSQSSTNVV